MEDCARAPLTRECEFSEILLFTQLFELNASAWQVYRLLCLLLHRFISLSNIESLRKRRLKL